MAYAVGVGLAVFTFVLGRFAGFDRERVFYPTILIVVASYYVLFAVMGGSIRSLMVESVVMAVFVLAAVIGFKLNAWLIVAALAGHGVFDLVHGYLTTNPGVPAWWPPFCSAFDITLALLVAVVIGRAGGAVRHQQTAPR